MKEIDFTAINNLKITPKECLDWATTVIKNKNNYVLPHKISITYGDNCYFNTMPAYIPEMNIIGVKEVSRIPNRSPTLQGDILLYDSLSGDIKCLMDGTWITTWRTAAIAAITVEKLKKSNAKSVSLMGLGNIARAFLLCLNTLRNNTDITINLLEYKDQHKLFIERFKEYKNIHFNVISNVKELIKVSDVVVSCITATTELFDDNNEDFKEGILLVPVMTRGFQNCDLFFDQVYCDDIPHVSNFKYFDKFKKLTELTDVMNNPSFVRNDTDRILAYNIGIAVHDMYFAAKILEKLDSDTNKNIPKFWV